MIMLLLFSEIGDFQKIVGSFIEVVDNVSKEVEKEKMKVKFSHVFTASIMLHLLKVKCINVLLYNAFVRFMCCICLSLGGGGWW